MSDGWHRIKGDKAEWLRRAPWIIAKALVDGRTLYVLSSDEKGGTRYGQFESAEEAKDYANRMELAAQA
jgi:hypothetical protein